MLQPDFFLGLITEEPVLQVTFGLYVLKTIFVLDRLHGQLLSGFGRDHLFRDIEDTVELHGSSRNLPCSYKRKKIIC